jgi:hypothetical protein
MRLELLDERSRSFVLALLGDPPGHRKRKRPARSGQKAVSSQQDTIHRLSEQLINNACGSHSLGLIYNFLLRTYRASARARAEFERYLPGNWSPEWVEAARRAVQEEQQQRECRYPGRRDRPCPAVIVKSPGRRGNRGSLDRLSRGLGEG